MASLRWISRRLCYRTLLILPLVWFFVVTLVLVISKLNVRETWKRGEFVHQVPQEEEPEYIYNNLLPNDLDPVVDRAHGDHIDLDFQDNPKDVHNLPANTGEDLVIKGHADKPKILRERDSNSNDEHVLKLYNLDENKANGGEDDGDSNVDLDETEDEQGESDSKLRSGLNDPEIVNDDQLRDVMRRGAEKEEEKEEETTEEETTEEETTEEETTEGEPQQQHGEGHGQAQQQPQHREPLHNQQQQQQQQQEQQQQQQQQQQQEQQQPENQSVEPRNPKFKALSSVTTQNGALKRKYMNRLKAGFNIVPATNDSHVDHLADVDRLVDELITKNEADRDRLQALRSTSENATWPDIPYLHSDGEDGKGIVIEPDTLSEEDRAKYDYGMDLHSFNQYVSDMVSVRRRIPEFRDSHCKQLEYGDSLPNTTVIVVFRNEAWTTLLRTVISVLSRSPPRLLHEVLLVDDDSDPSEFSFLKEPLEAFMAQFEKVKVIRSSTREGLIRARLLGAAVASGETLTFLDSHCEVSIGWLEPLLGRIAEDPSHVVMPIIDIIDYKTFAYKSGGSGSNPQIGGFRWNLQFEWDMESERERRRRRSTSDPVRSPTMAGGLFSIDRAYFYQIGSYDEGMNLWGAENLEMSFRIWMCGGSIELMPCSRVGHVFRPKNPNLDGSTTDYITTNTMRLVEVWMDDYKHIYYDEIDRRPLPGEYGDVSDRIQLRKDLGCKSFRWYLDNVYPEQFIPTDSFKSGRLQNSKRIHISPLCLDVEDMFGGKFERKPTIKTCRNSPARFYLSNKYELRTSARCLEYREDIKQLRLFKCHGHKGSQFWKVEQGNELRHVASNKCLTLTADGSSVEMKSCYAKENQSWLWR